MSLLLTQALGGEAITAAPVHQPRLPLDPLTLDALRALGSLDALTLDALGPLGPLTFDALRALGLLDALTLDTLRALGSLDALTLDTLRALGSLDPLTLDALRARLLCLGLAGLRLLGTFRFTVFAALGLGRSSDCKRRDSGDENRLGHGESTCWDWLHIAKNVLITT